MTHETLQRAIEIERVIETYKNLLEARNDKKQLFFIKLQYYLSSSEYTGYNGFLSRDAVDRFLDFVEQDKKRMEDELK